MPNTRLNLSLSFSELLTSSLAIESSEHSPGCQPAVQACSDWSCLQEFGRWKSNANPWLLLGFFGGKTKVPTRPMRSMILVLPGIFARHLLGIHWALTGLWTLEWVARCPHQSSHGIFDPEHTASCCPTVYLKTCTLIRNSYIFACSSESAVWYILQSGKFRERPPLDAWWWVWHSNSPEFNKQIIWKSQEYDRNKKTKNGPCLGVLHWAHPSLCKVIRMFGEFFVSSWDRTKDHLCYLMFIDSFLTKSFVLPMNTCLMPHNFKLHQRLRLGQVAGNKKRLQRSKVH